MRELSIFEIEEVSGAGAADVIVGAGLSRAASGAGAAFGAGLAEGFGAGAFLGPLGAVVGAMVGGGLAFYLLRPTNNK
ncbi:hypothetical protein RugamoR64_12790 [Duganella rhizosphaerae]|uniref:hypothetical protein n=1 Tax=Duganella rhizosphaerae TaxID=2885763 RepID=UPI0030E940D7